MRSLFLKIFLWYCLAIALIGVTLVVVTLATQPETERRRGAGALTYIAETAAATYETEGAQALNIFLNHRPWSMRQRASLYDAGGQALGGHTENPAAVALALQAAARPTNGGIVWETVSEARPFGETLAAVAITSPKGARYVLVAAWPRERPAAAWGRGRNPRQRRFLPAPWWVWPVSIGAIGMAVCFALARYLTGPVVNLQSAAQRLAAGDLTARVGNTMGRRRDELADLGHEFDRMAGRIENLVQAQRRLLVDISHELRSPLARQAVALELARRHAAGGNTDALDADFNRIEREAQRVNGMIGQLLLLARLESGETRPAEEPVALDKIVQDVVADAAFETQNVGREVIVTQCDALTLRGDHDLLRSAIENIVRNALHYTRDNTTVEVGLQRDAATAAAVVTVRDHGPGVPEDALADLFRPFYRVAEARDRVSGGAGLGLAITARAALLHGGEVQARNAPDGDGLIVELRLPEVRPESV